MKIACILLTADRSRFLPRAIACFMAQTYKDRELVVVDSGAIPAQQAAWMQDPRVIYHRPATRLTIGGLRNLAIRQTDADLIAHWDDDDWSHRLRLHEQVQLMVDTVDIVGYRDMLFYDSSHDWGGCQQGGDPSDAGSYEWVRYCKRCGMEDTCEDPLPSCSGELHLYSAGRGNTTMGLGTSYMYRRSSWDERPFSSMDIREDDHFLYHFDVKRRMFISSIDDRHEPAMIAEIHGGNINGKRDLAGQNWTKIVDESLIADVRKTLGY